jgi:ribosomal protein S18 acetylase RimI-like enzyme
MTSFKIRAYHPADLTAIYRICLQTGDYGKDASSLYKDPDLLGHMFAAPYAVLEPELCFILTRTGQPCGYILGTADSAMFASRCEREWFPPLRERYPLPGEHDTSPDDWIIRIIHQGMGGREDLNGYPAHLHIDLLPEAQGQGWGRQLMETFTSQLQRMGVPGVHLGVSKENQGAVVFYERVGFSILKDAGTYLIYGKQWAKKGKPTEIERLVIDKIAE